MSVIINSVDRTLDILIYLYNEGVETSITKISEDLKIYKSTVYRTLATLQAKDFVTKNPETEKYSLGTKLFIIGTSVGERLGIQKFIRPFAKQLHDEFNETVNVSILERNPMDIYRSVIIYKEENKQILRLNSEVGSRSDCHCAAVGKCLLAFCDNINLSIYEEHTMIPYTPNTIITLEHLKEELEKVREQGYAVDDEERELGLTCLGAPIIKNKKYAVAAISLSGPTFRMKDETFDYKIQRLCETAKEISKNLD
ncbi:IclR family transcriptional regulator [Oscillospiraceae bacterium PP1C4]